MNERNGCREAVARLWAYAAGELDESDHRAVQGHLAFCLRCCGELAFALELQWLLATMTGDVLPGDVRARLEAFIDVLDDAAGTGATR